MISFRELTVPERRCLNYLYMAEPFNNMPHVGRKSLDNLLDLGLIEEAKEETPFGADMHYRRTALGEEVWEAMVEANCVPR